MILNLTFATLAFLSLALLLWQWLAARQFPLHQRSADSKIGANRSSASDASNGNSTLEPAVTLLKSLRGCDAETEACLESWLTQDYAGEVQALFGVASAEDPVCKVVGKLLRKHPDVDAQLIVCEPLHGANAKVSKLARLEKLAKHEILVISDADVRVPPDFLLNLVRPLNCGSRPSEKAESRNQKAETSRNLSTSAVAANEIGLVNCFYRLANPTTLPMRWEAIAINADFWSQVLQSKSLKPLDFALGAVMATTRQCLRKIGGFDALSNCLADDYQLGNRIARQGHRIELCPVVVECWDPPMTLRAVWKHQLRWARTIRVCQPVPYFFSILSNPTLWPALWLVVHPTHRTAAGCTAMLLVRILTAMDLQTRLTRSRTHWEFFWLVPIKDLLQTAIWFLAFTGNHVEWRGTRYRLKRDGTLVKD